MPGQELAAAAPAQRAVPLPQGGVIDSWKLILPFLRPIAPLILDPSISEVMVNPGCKVYIERDGRIEGVPDVTGLSDGKLVSAVLSIARLLDDDISEEQPLLDARLPDGSRVAAILPPVSVGGVTLTIRKFTLPNFTIQDLVSVGTLTEEAADLLVAQVRARKTLLISGGTTTGKTTLLRLLAREIPAHERILVIEDTSELRLDRPHLVPLQARRKQGSANAVTIRQLVKASLRHRPDRIILGEVRDKEALDLLTALNTGHTGSLTTIHASNAERAISRLTTCVLMSGVRLPHRAIRAQIADGIDTLVHLERANGRRYVSEVLGIDGYDSERDTFALRRLYGGSHADTPALS
jgi:pilus assembly protein CpaF